MDEDGLRIVVGGEEVLLEGGVPAFSFHQFVPEKIDWNNSGTELLPVKKYVFYILRLPKFFLKFSCWFTYLGKDFSYLNLVTGRFKSGRFESRRSESGRFVGVPIWL